eukprot:2979601-Rhodomonas_salina.1
MSGAASGLEELDIDQLSCQCADASEVCASISWVFGGEERAGCGGGVDGTVRTRALVCGGLDARCGEPVA